MSFQPPPRECELSTAEIAERVIAAGEKIAGKEFYPYQYVFAAAFITAVLDRKTATVTALFSRQTGKTEVVAVVIISCAILLPYFGTMYPHDRRFSLFGHRGFWAGAYAPKDEQAKLAFTRARDYATSDAAKEAYAELGIELISSSADQLKWSNGSRVRARTASETSHSEGETWDAVVCDEAQNISTNKIDKELRPMLASTAGSMILIGTTGGAAAYFHRRIEKNKQAQRESGEILHFEADYELVLRQKRAKYEDEADRYNKFKAASAAKQRDMLADDPRAGDPPNEFHLYYQKVIDSTIADFGGLAKAKENETFQQNYMLLLGQNSRFAIPPDVWVSRGLPDVEMNGPMPSHGFVVGGLDVATGAGASGDQTVLSFLHVDTSRPIVDRLSADPGSAALMSYMKTLLGVYTFRGDFELSQYAGIIEVIRMYPGLVKLAVDSNGMGLPVYQRLRSSVGSDIVEAVNWASLNTKSLSCSLFMTAVKNGHFQYAAGPNTRTMPEFKDMHEQVTGVVKDYVGAGKVVIFKAAEEDENDDYPDSLAFACHAEQLALEANAHNKAEGFMPEIEWTRGTIGSASWADRESHEPSRSDRYRYGRRGASRYNRSAM